MEAADAEFEVAGTVVVTDTVLVMDGLFDRFVVAQGATQKLRHHDAMLEAGVSVVVDNDVPVTVDGSTQKIGRGPIARLCVSSSTALDTEACDVLAVTVGTGLTSAPALVPTDGSVFEW